MADDLGAILISFSFRLERPVLARLRRRRRAHENAGRRCLQLTVAARAEPRPVPSAAAPDKRLAPHVRTASAPSAPTPKSNPANGFAAQSVQTVARDADGSGNGNAPTVGTKPLKSNAGIVADDAGMYVLAVLVQRNCRLSERRRPQVPENSLPTNLGQRSRAAGSGGVGRSWLGSLIDGPRWREVGGLNLPDVALLDFHLRGGERSDGLIAQLRQQGIPVILLSGVIRISHTVIAGWHDAS